VASAVQSAAGFSCKELPEWTWVWREVGGQTMGHAVDMLIDGCHLGPKGGNLKNVHSILRALTLSRALYLYKRKHWEWLGVACCCCGTYGPVDS